MSSPTDLPALTLLLQEIQSLTSSMRRNQRWASGTSQHFTTSQPPLPPYLRTGVKRAPSVKKARPSIDGAASTGADEGDLMGGFVELRRTLIDTKSKLESLGTIVPVADNQTSPRSPLWPSQLHFSLSYAHRSHPESLPPWL